MPKLKHPTIKQLKNKLWKLISECVRIEEKGVCFTCGVKKDWKETDCGHLIHQAKTSRLAYERKLLHCQCTKCNRYLSGNLLEYTTKMIKIHGIEQIEKWKFEARKPYNWKISELEVLVEEWKLRLKELKTLEHIIMDSVKH